MATIQETSDAGIGTVRVTREAMIAAPIGVVFESILAELGPEGQFPDGRPMSMRLEAWPGGRWFRDLGDKAGHLWGHVQVIKPPTLLEITGPLFMSYPAVNHVQYRLVEEGGRTRLTFTHRGLGALTDEHRAGVEQGWSHWTDRIRERAERSGR